MQKRLLGATSWPKPTSQIHTFCHRLIPADVGGRKGSPSWQRHWQSAKVEQGLLFRPMTMVCLGHRCAVGDGTGSNSDEDEEKERSFDGEERWLS